MNEQDTMLVNVADSVVRRKGGLGPRELKIEVLAENVNIFLSKIENVIAKTPDSVGQFRLTEFTVTAEVSGEGALVLMGSGVKAEASGGLTFKFERK